MPFVLLAMQCLQCNEFRNGLNGSTVHAIKNHNAIRHEPSITYISQSIARVS